MSIKPVSSDDSFQPVLIEPLSLKKAFEDVSTPITPLPPPVPDVKPQSAKDDILTKTTQITLDPTIIPSERKGTIERVKGRVGEVVSFVKKHPFLAGGMVLGVLLLFCAFPTLASSFAQITGVTLFHAQLTIGLGLGLMIFYYGIYLINLARRAAVKDELESKLESIQSNQSSLGKTTSEEEMNKIVKDISSQAQTLKTEMLEEVENRKSKQDNLEKTLYQMTSQSELLKTKQTLESLLEGIGFKNLPIEKQTEIKILFKQISDQVTSGAHALTKERPLFVNESETPIKSEQFFLEPVFEAPQLPNEMTLSPPSSATQAERKVMQATIKSKLGDLISSIGTFAKEKPASFALIVLGVIFTLVAIPALVYWMHGFTSVYLLGTLTLAGVIQFIVYGVSLIYEGYNSGMIDQINKDLLKIEEDGKQRKEELQKMESQVERIQEKGIQSLAQYKTAWEKHLSSLNENFQREITIFSESSQRQKLLNDCKNAIIEILQVKPELLPSSSEQFQAVDQPFQGMTSVLDQLKKTS